MCDLPETCKKEHIWGKPHNLSTKRAKTARLATKCTTNTKQKDWMVTKAPTLRKPNNPNIQKWSVVWEML